MSTTIPSKYQLATAIAILFHAIGLAGILLLDREFFIRATPLILLLSFLLIIWTQKEKNVPFFLFLLIVFFIGFTAEWIGVQTGWLFGDYSYGDTLGYKWHGVPLLIGINWCIIIYCCGISVHTFLMKIIHLVARDDKQPPRTLKAISLIVDGATLAVFLDWLMEPVAIKLGFWKWNGSIPLYNYFCWFLISLILLSLFHFCKFNKQNKFAVNLLLIQAMFFLLLRTLLK